MPEVRCFYTDSKERRYPVLHDMREITDEQVRALENTGAAHLAYGSCWGEDVAGPYMVFVPGPGNCWIETVEGNCPHCGCMAKLHVKRSRDFSASIESAWDWGTLCTGCDDCRVDIPHGKVESVLGTCETF